MTTLWDQGKQIIALLHQIEKNTASRPLAAPLAAPLPTLSTSGQTTVVSGAAFLSIPALLAVPAVPTVRGTGIYFVQGKDGELPDPDATPGAINPDVIDDPAILKATIGTSGWTATVRPPVTYTDAVKRNVLVEYGLTGALADYELDHLVPLCCGGHPTAIENLWPQRRAGVSGAPLKDVTEVLAQHAVLAGHLSLAAAQQGFMTNWTLLHAHLTSLPAVMTLLMGLAPPEPEP